MIAKTFGEFILRHRTNASLSALAFSLIPFLGWFSIVIVMLVTLRKGALEGLLILLWAALPDLVKCYYSVYSPLLIDIVAGGVSGWLLAVVLKQKNSWSGLLYLATILGILGVALVHVVVHAPDQFWMQQLSNYLSQGEELFSGAATYAPKTQAQLQDILNYVLQFATGIQAVFIMLGVLAELIIARNIQLVVESKLPISQELYSIRLSPIIILPFLCVLIPALLGSHFFRDLLPVMLFPFFIAGISLFHGLAVQKKLSTIWVFSFYLILILIMAFFPPLFSLLALVAMIDSFINFRALVARVKKRGV